MYEVFTWLGGRKHWLGWPAECAIIHMSKVRRREKCRRPVRCSPSTRLAVSPSRATGLRSDHHHGTARVQAGASPAGITVSDLAPDEVTEELAMNPMLAQPVLTDERRLYIPTFTSIEL